MKSFVASRLAPVLTLAVATASLALGSSLLAPAAHAAPKRAGSGPKTAAQKEAEKKGRRKSDVVFATILGVVIGSTMVGLALGPYASGKVAALTGSLQVGVFSLLVAPAAAILILWRVSRVAHDIERTKLARANAVGEP